MLHKEKFMSTVQGSVLSLAFVLSIPVYASQSEVVADMGAQFERFSTGVLLADRGESNGYRLVNEGIRRFSADLEIMQQGGLFEGGTIAPPTEAVEASLNTLVAAWKPYYDIGNNLQSLEATLEDVKNGVKKINDDEPRIIELSLQIAVLRAQHGGSPTAILAASKLTWLHMRFIKNANRVLFDDVVVPEVAFLVEKDPKEFVSLIEELLYGSKIQDIAPARGQEKKALLELSKLFATNKNAAAVISKNLFSIITIKQASRDVITRGDEFFKLLLDLRKENSVEEPRAGQN